MQNVCRSAPQQTSRALWPAVREYTQQSQFFQSSRPPSPRVLAPLAPLAPLAILDEKDNNSKINIATSVVQIDTHSSPNPIKPNPTPSPASSRADIANRNNDNSHPSEPQTLVPQFPTSSSLRKTSSPPHPSSPCSVHCQHPARHHSDVGRLAAQLVLRPTCST